jgi:transcription elongation factor Elf1
MVGSVNAADLADLLSMRFICVFCGSKTSISDTYVDQRSGDVLCPACHVATAEQLGVLSFQEARRRRDR